MAPPRKYFPNENSRRSLLALSQSEICGTLIAGTLLLSLLVPIFGAIERKSHLSTCQDNLRQFSAAILLYSADYDRAMPFAISGHNQVGPAAAAFSDAPEFNLPLEVLPYVHNSGIFTCPDDHGFAGEGFVNIPGATPLQVPATTSVAEAYGTSYQITRQSFTELSTDSGPSYDAVCPISPAGRGCRGLGDLVSLPTQTGQLTPAPQPLTLPYFARPAETTLLSDDWAWTSTALQSEPLSMHPTGANFAFADGHVKFVPARAGRDAFCDGPTFSPARLTTGGQDRGAAFGDGSCNTAGQERRIQGDMN